MVSKNKKHILHIVVVLTCAFVLLFSISPVKVDAFGYQTNETSRTFAEFPLVFTGRVGGRQAYGLPLPSSVAQGDINSPYPIQYGFGAQGDSFPLLQFTMQPSFGADHFAYTVSALYPSASEGIFERDAVFACPYPVVLNADSSLTFIYPVPCTYMVQATIWSYDEYSTSDQVISEVRSQPYTFTYDANANESVDILGRITNPSGTILTNLFIFVELGSSCQQFIIATSAVSDPQTRFGQFMEELNFSYDLENNVTIVESEFPTSWTDWLITTVSGFFAFEIAPGLSFGTIFISIFGVLLLWFILHLFM